MWAVAAAAVGPAVEPGPGVGAAAAASHWLADASSAPDGQLTSKFGGSGDGDLSTSASQESDGGGSDRSRAIARSPGSAPISRGRGDSGDLWATHKAHHEQLGREREGRGGAGGGGVLGKKHEGQHEQKGRAREGRKEAGGGREGTGGEGRGEGGDRRRRSERLAREHNATTHARPLPPPSSRYFSQDEADEVGAEGVICTDYPAPPRWATSGQHRQAVRVGPGSSGGVHYKQTVGVAAGVDGNPSAAFNQVDQHHRSAWQGSASGFRGWGLGLRASVSHL